VGSCERLRRQGRGEPVLRRRQLRKPFCIYPWYTSGTTGFHYGVNFPDTVNDYSTYCDTVIKR